MTTHESPAEVRLLNETLMSQLESRDPHQQKTANDALNTFTRTTVREEGFYRNIIPMLPITPNDLTPQVDTDKPVRLEEREPNSPGSASIPFGTLPDNLYLYGDKYLVHFDRIVTRRFTKDVAELGTYRMDLRQVISDNAIKDIHSHEDQRFMRSVDNILLSPGQTNPTSGVSQYQEISGGITRDSFSDSLAIMPSTPSNLEVKTVLMNQLTVKQLMKWGRDELGGDMSQKIVQDGWTSKRLMGVDLVVTIKKGLVATNKMYHFADPRYIGKSYEFEKTTMYVKREAFMLEFFMYEMLGGTIGWTSGVSAAKFV